MAATSSLCGRSVSAEALITSRHAVITSEFDGTHRNSINGLENINQLTASLKCVSNIWIYTAEILVCYYIYMIFLIFRILYQIKLEK